MRLAFMGTPDFAVPSLAELIASGHEVVAVYSLPPKPRGRGQKLTPSPVHAFAETMGLPVFTPASMKACTGDGVSFWPRPRGFGGWE